MIKKGDETGQFYLISAVVLAILVIGFFTIANYSREDSDAKLTYLKEEIQTESRYLFDYGLYNEISDLELHGLLINFTQDYIDYQKKNTNLYFIFGDKDNITVTGYQKTQKDVSISSGSSATITNETGEFMGGIDPEIDTLTLSIDNTPYEFDLTKGKNFYFVLSQKINRGENIIIG